MPLSADDQLPKPLLDALARHGGVRHFPAHAILINEGDSTDSLYIVLSGRLRIYASGENGREVVLAEHPDFALHLTAKLIRMVRRLTEQVKSLALQDVYGRIARLASWLVTRPRGACGG